MAAPLMLKIGGGRDKEEAKIDPDMVVLGSHAGFMNDLDPCTTILKTNMNLLSL